MNNIIDKLSKNVLFNNINKEKIYNIIKNTNYSLRTYKKSSIIAEETQCCSSLALIINGTVELQRIYESGNYIVLKRLGEGNVFGEALVFSKKHNYPATVIAGSDCEILFIERESILEICLMEKILLQNFIELLSDKVLLLNSKIKNISFNTVRKKVINYILEQGLEQKSDKIVLGQTKESISAEMLIPRPSFSRELIKLREEGLICFDRKTITIIEKEALQNELLK